MPRISDFPIKNTPSTSAMLSGVDNGENIQIPVNKFVTKNEDGGFNITANHIHMGQEDGKAAIDFLGDDDVEIVGNAVYITGLRALTAPDSNGSENLSYGNAGQVLMSNGDNVYWGDAPSASNSNCNTFAYTVEDTTTMADLINDMTAKGYTIGDKAILTLKGSIRGTFAGYISTSAGNTLFIFNWIEVSTLTRYEMTTNRYTTATVTESFETATKTLSSGIDVFTYATSGGDLLSSVINTVLSTNINTKGFMLNLTGAYSGIYYCSASRDSGSIYNFTLTDLVDLKSYKVSHMDTTGITLSEFFSNYEVKQESSDGSSSNYLTVEYWELASLQTILTPMQDNGDIIKPTFVRLVGPYTRPILIWFEECGGDSGSYNVYCWDLQNRKYYFGEHITPSAVSFEEFFSSTYEVASESSSSSGFPDISLLWNSPFDTIANITSAIKNAGLELSNKKVIVQLYGYGSALLLCDVASLSDGFWSIFARNLYDGKSYEARLVDPSTITISNFLNTENYLVGGGSSSDSGLPYESVYWGNPMSDMLSNITAVVTPNTAQKTIIQVYGYGAALLLVNGSTYHEGDTEMWQLLVTDLYTGKMYQISSWVDPATISIKDFLYSGDYDVASSSSGNTSSGGGSSIIYATEKPSTPQQAIYVITEDEVKKVEIVQEGVIIPSEYAYVEVVDTLPEFGTVAVDLTTQYLYCYYLTTDGMSYGYVDTTLSEATGGQLSVGWYPASNLFVIFGKTDGGLITSLDQATDESAIYLLLTTEPRTRVYVPMPDGAFLELTTGIRTRFDANNGTVSITEM